MSGEPWEAAATTRRVIEIWVLHFFTSVFNSLLLFFFFFKATEGELMAEHLTLSQSDVASPVLVSSPARSRLWPSHRRCLFFRRSVDPVGLEEFTWAVKPLRILPPGGALAVLSNRGCCYLSSTWTGPSSAERCWQVLPSWRRPATVW